MSEGKHKRVALAPFIGEEGGSEQTWLGAALGKLVSEQLAATKVPALDVLHYNAISQASLKLDRSLPLDSDGVKAMMAELKLSALVAGGFRLAEGKLHLALTIHSDEGKPATISESAETKEFAALTEQVTLALVNKLGLNVDDKAQERLKATARPRKFEAFQQVARARAAWADENFPLALSLVESALSMEPQLEEAAEVRIGAGSAANDPQIVIEGFVAWIDIAEQQKRPLERAHRLLLYGHWLMSQTRWEAAESAYQEALKIYGQQSNRLGKAQALENLANLALQRGNVGEAIESYRKSIAVYEIMGADEEIATATFNLALGYRAQGQSQLALDALADVLGMTRRLKDRTLEAAALDQRATIYNEEENPNLARSDYQRALTIYEEEDDLPGLATVKDHLALLLASEGEFAAAEALRLEAIALFEGFADRHELAVAWANMAALYMEMGTYEQAWDYAQQAHDVFTQLGSGMQELTERLLAQLG